MHRYLYANADPVNRMDPSGHFVLTIDVSFSAIIQQTLRFLGGAVSADIGNEIGGIPGAIIGAIAGGFAFGRLGSWLTRVEYTATETAAAAKTATAANAGNSSSAAKAAIQNAAIEAEALFSWQLTVGQRQFDRKTIHQFRRGSTACLRRCFSGHSG